MRRLRGWEGFCCGDTIREPQAGSDASQQQQYGKKKKVKKNKKKIDVEDEAHVGILSVS